jgi:hypothetical protein
VNPLWAYFWPPFAAALLLGGVAGSIVFHRRRRRHALLATAIVVALAFAALWHGPLGGGLRFSSAVERNARDLLDAYEVPQVAARLHHDPLTRRLMLSGPADDFQARELVRIMGALPGVSSASWSSSRAGAPLIVEGVGASVLGFLFGLLLAYLVALRRRYNAQWNW